MLNSDQQVVSRILGVGANRLSDAEVAAALAQLEGLCAGLNEGARKVENLIDERALTAVSSGNMDQLALLARQESQLRERVIFLGAARSGLQKLRAKRAGE